MSALCLALFYGPLVIYCSQWFYEIVTTVIPAKKPRSLVVKQLAWDQTASVGGRIRSELA